MERDESRANGNAFREALTPRRLGEYLMAILGGNIIYLFIEPQLPTILRHRLYRVDLGLGLDFLICALAYGLVRLFRPSRDHQG